MNHSIIQILIICAYIGVLFLISGYVKMRSAGSSENYVLAGRKMTTPLIMVSIIGLAVGGASTIGGGRTGVYAWPVCRLVYCCMGHWSHHHGTHSGEEVSPHEYHHSF